MHEVQIADASIDECFERRQSDSLENTAPQYTRVVIVAMCRATPGRSCHHQKRAEQEQVSLAPDSCRCHKQPTSNTHADQMVGRQKCRILKGPLEEQGKGDRVCRE
jgi:hypothetical protein